MPRIPPRLQKQDLQKSRSIPDSCSRDSALRRRTTHRPAPARPASISPPAPRPLDPNVLQPLRLHRSSGFRIRPRPTLFDSLSSPASPWRPKASRGAARGTFPRQFPRPPVWPARARVLPSASRQTSAPGHIFSTAPGTSRSGRATKLFSLEPAHLIRARSRTPSPRDSSARSPWRHSRLWTSEWAFARFRISSPEERDQKSGPGQQNWEYAACKFLHSAWPDCSGFRASSLCILRQLGRPRRRPHFQSFLW